MAEKKSPLPLIIRHFPGEPLDPSSATDLVEEIFSLLPEDTVRIFWNLPGLYASPAYAKAEELIDYLAERIDRKGDRILSSGWTGCPHSFLDHREREMELEWGRRQWIEALNARGISPWTLPLYPDYSAEDGGRSESPLPQLRLERDSARPERPLLRFAGGNTLSLFDFTTPPEPRKKRFFQRRSAGYVPDGSARRALKEETGWGILIPSSGIADPRGLYTVAKLLSPGDGSSLLEHLPRETGGEEFRGSGGDGEPPRFWTPRWRERLLNGAAATSSTDEDLPQKLITLAGHEMPPSGRNGRRVFCTGPVKRTLLADMLGEVTLADDLFSVHFSRGTWAGITRGDEELLPRQEASSFITIDHTPLPFLPSMAYSFEEENARGLREIQIFQHPSGETGRFTNDYYFTEGFPLLFLSATAEFPRLTPGEIVTSYAPGEKKLFSLEEEDFPLVCESGSRKSEIRIQRIPGEQRYVHPVGREFCFSAGKRSFYIGLAAPEYPPDMILPVRIEKEGSNWGVFINPWGNYHPLDGREASRFKEQVTFIIGAGSRQELPDLAAFSKLCRGIPAPGASR